jgi:hypothetical protein
MCSMTAQTYVYIIFGLGFMTLAAIAGLAIMN